MDRITIHIPKCAADGLCVSAVLLAESRRFYSALPLEHPLREAVDASCDAVDRALAQVIEHGGEPMLTHLLAKAIEFGWDVSTLEQEMKIV